MSINRFELPTVALRGLCVLPGRAVHFDISREKSIHAVENAINGDGKLFLVSQCDMEVSVPSEKDLYKVGTIANVTQIIKLPNKIIRVMVEGKARAEIESVDFSQNHIISKVVVKEYKDILSKDEKKAYLEILVELARKYFKVNPVLVRDGEKKITSVSNLTTFMDRFVDDYILDYVYKQEYLEAATDKDRFEMMSAYLVNATNILEIKKSVAEQVKEKIDKNQKEYVLREQMKVIKKELGVDEESDDTEYLTAQAKGLTASQKVKDRILKEIKKYKNIPENVAESHVIRNYIDTLLALPWDKTTKDNDNFMEAKKVLDEDHYGLTKVKERILEFLAVRQLSGSNESTMICLVGPPGTGKTSIAKSIARALNKNYVRICLGGVRDEAEIRGHRRTYVGAMPGRIITALKEAKSANPLMLLDEIDKVGTDNYRGDTQAALLEVLDGQQNCNFRDHYVELPVDLSKVLFIATANDISTISGPLRDRMEIIELSSYMETEKFHIAKKYLVTKQLKANGLNSKQLSISDGALRKIINGYTKEAGVRGLERKIGDICRKAAVNILMKDSDKITVTDRNLKEYLGPIKYTREDAFKKDEIGIVRGLAWTSVGGDTLSIEINAMTGKGSLQLTGKLGDVMKESAQTALSYVKSIAKNYNVPEDYFEKHDLHIHIPEGATPKDGPSAGITLATAILSVVTEKKVNSKVAMTGEITLRGRVLAIGGLKEKLLAANMAGIKKVIVPIDNKKDVEELEEEITQGMEIVFAETMKDVIPAAFI